jgi:hypothetical protein
LVRVEHGEHLPVRWLPELRGRIPVYHERLIPCERVPLLVHEGLAGPEVDGAVPVRGRFARLLVLVALYRHGVEGVSLDVLPIGALENGKPVEPGPFELGQERVLGERS